MTTGTDDPIDLIDHVKTLLGQFAAAKGSFPPDQEEQVEEILRTLKEILDELLSHRNQ